MTRSKMIEAIAEQKRMPQTQVAQVLDGFVENIVKSLQRGESVTIQGLGRFEMRQRATKAFTNPKTGKRSQLAPRAVPGLKVSVAFKDAVRKG